MINPSINRAKKLPVASALALCLLAQPIQAGERYGLIFVYRTDCKASRAFSASLKLVTDRYGMAVLPAMSIVKTSGPFEHLI